MCALPRCAESPWERAQTELESWKCQYNKPQIRRLNRTTLTMVVAVARIPVAHGTLSYTLSATAIGAVKWPKRCRPREERYQFRYSTSLSLWLGASFTTAGMKCAARSTYFAFLVRSPRLLRSRPTREPCTLRSDTGIQSLIHSSSRRSEE